MVAWALLVGFLSGPIQPAVATAQEQAQDSAPLLLLPLGETIIDLLTHTVDVAVSVDGDRALRLEVAAAYRLHNPKLSEGTLLLQVNTPPDASPAAQNPPQSISLTSDGQLISLQPTGNGLQQTAQLSFGPDARRTLLLRYTLLFVTDDLPAFVYPANTLNAWPGRIGSWRITLNFANTASGLLGPDNWLATEPEGWSYNGTRLQWLSENPLPTKPFRWQVIHPAIWQEIQTRRQTIQQQPDIEEFRLLGDRYRQLFDTASRIAEAEETNRERFYVQALSAYADGIVFAQERGLLPQEQAELHRALAALYRSRSIGADGRIDFSYVQLMAVEAEAALNSLPPEAAAERSEMSGWLADGLRLQARQAQQRKDWPTALGLLDRLAALPEGIVDPIRLAEERRLLLLEQSLQLLAQGNEEAAMKAVGTTIALDDLLPAAERQTIFARWNFSLTVNPGEPLLTGAGLVVSGREDEARRLADQLAQVWDAVSTKSGTAQVAFDGRQVLVTLAGLSLGERLALVQATPQNTHWALLRTLLVNAEGEIETTGHLVWQRTALRHSIDLRPVADQWNGIAASLERDSLSTSGSAATEERIQSELRAILHRQEAERWQRLARESRIQVELTASPEAAPGDGRVWSLQPGEAPQSLGYVAESISTLRLLLAIAVTMATLLTLAGILWLLL